METERPLVDRRDRFSVLLRDVRRIFRRRQRHTDARRNGLLGINELHRANGIKNFLGICINSIAVFSFALAGLVVWQDALVMACGALIGGYFGASMAVRVGQIWVRRGIVAIGLVIFVVMVWRLRYR